MYTENDFVPEITEDLLGPKDPFRKSSFVERNGQSSQECVTKNGKTPCTTDLGSIVRDFAFIRAKHQLGVYEEIEPRDAYDLVANMWELRKALNEARDAEERIDAEIQILDMDIDLESIVDLRNVPTFISYEQYRKSMRVLKEILGDDPSLETQVQAACIILSVRKKLEEAMWAPARKIALGIGTTLLSKGMSNIAGLLGINLAAMLNAHSDQRLLDSYQLDRIVAPQRERCYQILEKYIDGHDAVGPLLLAEHGVS